MQLCSDESVASTALADLRRKVGLPGSERICTGLEAEPERGRASVERSAEGRGMVGEASSAIKSGDLFGLQNELHNCLRLRPCPMVHDLRGEIWRRVPQWRR